MAQPVKPESLSYQPSRSITRIDAFFDISGHFVKRLKLFLREAESLFLELAIVILAVLKLLDMLLK